eukprot:5416180-Prymnesium_polylepis.1
MGTVPRRAAVPIARGAEPRLCDAPSSNSAGLPGGGYVHPYPVRRCTVIAHSHPYGFAFGRSEIDLSVVGPRGAVGVGPRARARAAVKTRKQARPPGGSGLRPKRRKGWSRPLENAAAASRRTPPPPAAALDCQACRQPPHSLTHSSRSSSVCGG